MYGGVEFYGRKEVKDALAYLRLAVFGDDLSFERVINIPPRGIGRKRLNALRTYAAEENQPLAKALEVLCSTPLFKGTGAEEFLQILNLSREKALSSDPFEALDYILHISGYEAFLHDSGGKERLNNLNELKADCRE